MKQEVYDILFAGLCALAFFGGMFVIAIIDHALGFPIAYWTCMNINRLPQDICEALHQ